MLFKQEDLYTPVYDPIQEAADILNESVYLTEEESILNVNTVPVVTNERIGAHVVAFNDVERLAEDHGVDYITAMQAIAEANEIDFDSLATSVPEWKVIADPEVVNELNNVIIAPISSSNPVYQFVEACINAAIEEDNMGYVDICLEAISDKRLSQMINTFGVGTDAANRASKLYGPQQPGIHASGNNWKPEKFDATGRLKSDSSSSDPTNIHADVAKQINKDMESRSAKQKKGWEDAKVQVTADLHGGRNAMANNPALKNSVTLKPKDSSKPSSGLVPVAAEKPKTSVLDGKPQLNFHGKEAQPDGSTTKAHLFGTHNYGIPGINTGKRAEEAKKEEKGKTSSEEQPKQNQQQQSQQTQQSTQQAQEKVKEAEKVTENTPKGKIAQLIASLKKYYTNLKDKINKTDPKNRTIFQKVMSKIISVIDKLTGFLKKKSTGSEPATA